MLILRITHCFVPFCTFVGYLLRSKCKWPTFGKMVDILSLFTYLMVIAMVCFHRMNNKYILELTGYNLWFHIEISCFYAHILAGICYIIKFSVKSSMGMEHRNKNDQNHDFLDYHKADLEWYSTIFINLYLCVNKILFDEERMKTEINKHRDGLKHCIIILMIVHLSQFALMDKLYSLLETTNVHNRASVRLYVLLWIFQILAYMYVFVRWIIEMFKKDDEKDFSEFRITLIPLDILLTVMIFINLFIQVIRRRRKNEGYFDRLAKGINRSILEAEEGKENEETEQQQANETDDYAIDHMRGVD